LIVTRRRGHRSFLGKLRVGEMVRQIAAHAHCPLMMVPRAAHAPTRSVLTVIEEGSAIVPEMRAACAMALALGLPVGVLVVLPEGRSADAGTALVQRSQAVAEQAHIKAEGSVQSGRLADVVAARLRAAPVDLLVVGIPPGPARHGKLGDTVESVVSEAPCATLLVGADAVGA
jgi:nucleotide-binding universal stress UspA family protein